ncbi:glycoside hydrolase family 2 protein [Allorhizobium sp. BGMRC 0089]|uniref:glycosyl hydrolase 2 galactose-binding domain-containing protein n=1 Tax=Allorhizobium sonneratiae TaxID=2934936 RepID=UPI0020343C60|nr:glycoside hydrolase family 2 protein [Allorhizobium sonneratiae]MCM2294730.1 glycoside hydrolase family 2 protein [Allorhizobium sonneratiae]
MLTIFADADIRPLEGGWTMLTTEAGAHSGPENLPQAGFRIPGRVPGTVAGALASAGLFDPEKPIALHDRDVWYLRSLEGEAPGVAILRFEGLATITEIYLNDEHLLSSNSMFEAHEVAVMLTGHDRLALCFRALSSHLAKRGPRARWRPQMFSTQGLRLTRTTALGHMPGWCPPIDAIGPWRPISLIRPGKHTLTDMVMTTDLDADGSGHLDLTFRREAGSCAARLSCGGKSVDIDWSENGDGRARLALPGIAPWWPATHGEPALHTVTLTLEGQLFSLGLTGFRRIRIDRGADGRDFSLIVNGERVFCRGAVWTSANILTLTGEAEDYAPFLALAKEAGMNMIRIGGTMAYESADFFKLCDRLGLMVWQDMMLANFDYPAEAGFVDAVTREAEQLLSSSMGSPSLAVLCGGSEIYQQAAMLGLGENQWQNPIFTDLLPKVAARLRPDIAYVENTPIGGAMPFSPNAGLAHYYGVGAYQRDLDDARRSQVRFASECLAFAHVPQQATLDSHLAVPPVQDPRWKARVPRDNRASWDFEDIRDHYLARLYDVDPARLRREDPERYLHLSRAVTGDVLEEVFAEWRRPGSTCHGGLIWTFQDIMPGPGWGLVDSTATPKPVWYAARRAFASVKIALTDEGTNGLDLHLINDQNLERPVHLSLACLRQGKTPVVSAKCNLTLAPHSAKTLAATDLFGAFFDTTYAFRFGPPAHDVTVASLSDLQTGALVSQAFHFPQGRSSALYDGQISARLEENDSGWSLLLSAERLAQSVNIRLDHGRADDDFFHLSPLAPRRVRLLSEGQKPSGEVVTASGEHLRF